MAPRAEKKAHSFTKHNLEINDPYFWLREKENPEVIRILEQENEHFEHKLKGVSKDKNKIFKELKSRILENDDTVPYKRGEFEYFYRFKKGQQYSIFCQIYKKKTRVLVDFNKLVAKDGYLRVGNIDVSADGRYLAYTIDTDGSELFDLVVTDLKTNKEISRIKKTHDQFEWSNIDMLYYMTLDGHLRPDKVWRHILGNEIPDQCIFEEKDKRFFVNVEVSASKKYLIISAGEQISSYASVMELDNLEDLPTLFKPHKEKVEYAIDHIHDSFYIHTNEKATNFKIMTCSDTKWATKNWKNFVAHNEKVLITSMVLSNSSLVCFERSGGLPKIRVINLSNKKSYYVKFMDEAYSFFPMPSFEAEDDKIRIAYSSFIRPKTIIDIELKTKKQKIRKQDKIKGFDPKKYKVEFVFATSHDKKKIPMCIVYKKGLKKNGTNPGFIYSYGSYGSSIPHAFRSSLISLFDRGFVYANVGVRGSSDMGREWYETGKFLKKKNTFLDFISATEYLVKKKYISKDKIAAEGASAGGMLMGAITNMRPDLYKVIFAHVPFVDVINTMFDTSLPLTTVEFNEWGNPEEKKFFNYMRSYSPYDNVGENYFPNMYVTAGLNDQRVTYWEPMKWVQKLRDFNLSENDILLKVNMGEGHFGKSGRYSSLMELAEQYAYLIEKMK